MKQLMSPTNKLFNKKYENDNVKPKIKKLN